MALNFAFIAAFSASFLAFFKGDIVEAYYGLVGLKSVDDYSM